ncbi:MAG TPA: type II 3-dehydroquinate dehydratase [Ruminococcaceae bacterium]|nr:type II 3-dehydroquinate dehydratase [Oscillospiraceae bacterium]
MKLLVLNGPNINFLGIREPEIYGRESYADLLKQMENYAEEHNIEIECYQSNHEGDLVDKIQQAYGNTDGIVFNPAAYTHTSIAIADAVKAVGIPTVEVHLTDTQTREDFRRVSYVRPACVATVQGLGINGYTKALDILKSLLK